MIEDVNRGTIKKACDYFCELYDAQSLGDDFLYHAGTLPDHGKGYTHPT